MAEQVTAPSGKVYQWTRPPRRVHWRHGRAGRTFASKVEEIASGSATDDDERGMLLLESMSDGDLAGLERYADDVLTHGLGHPPGDMPEADYWFFFARSVYGLKEMKVATAEGEMSAEALDTFPEKPGVPADGEGGADVRVQPCPADGDS